MIQVFQTSLPGVIKIQREIFRDHRGVNVDVYDERVYANAGIDTKFVQNNYSTSVKNVLRGLHGDGQTFKLICCTLGSFVLAVVNYVDGSPYFGKWEKFTLTDDNGLQILVPPYHLNGHLILSDKATFFYNQSSHYTGPENQWSARWDDPRFNISWPIKDPILSKRDRGDT